MPRGKRKDKAGVDPQGWKAEGEQTDQRVTNQGNGSSMAVAPKAELEPIVLPPAEEALAVLEKLAQQNQRVEIARKRYEESAATTKARKGTWETEAQALSTLLSEATHAKPLPLFDSEESERELARMEQAIDAMQRNSPAAADAGTQAETSEAEPLSTGSVVPFVAEAF